MAEQIKYKIKGIDVNPDKMSFKFIVPSYNPTPKKQKVITDVFARFGEMRSNRDQAFRWFGKKRDGTYRNLLQYLDMSRKRWNSDGVPRTNLDEWQASVFKPETRNKVISILAVVAQQRPGNNFRGVEDGDKMKEMLVKDLYDWTEDVDDGDENALYAALDATVDGTVVRYEGYEENVRIVRDILPESDFSTNDLKFKEKTIINRKIITKDVALQDFYPGNVRVRASRIRDMGDCAWRKVMRYNDFRVEFNGWKEVQYVMPGGNLTDETFFASLVSDTIRYENSELVEVIRYYNKEADQFVIIANGVWINPLPKDVVSPLPFNHKELPFWGFVFEPFASDFFWGKSLPDKMRGEQDAINGLYNMMIDQGFISANSVILSGSPDSIDDPDLTPGKINYVGGDINQIKELTFSGPGAPLFNLLNLLHGSLEQSSVSAQQSGQVEGTNTATEVRQAAASAARSFTLFLTFIFHGYKRKGLLRAQNILQFLTSPQTLTRYLGDGKDEEFEEAFTPFNIPNVSLSNGKSGTRIIQMVGSRKELSQKYASREEERAKLEPRGIEKFYITPEYIRDFQFDVVPIPDSTLKETPEVLRALETEFQTTVSQLYPDKVNRDALFDDFLDVFSKDKEKLKIQPTMAPQGNPMMGELQNGQQNGQQGSNMSSQIINRATGGPSAIGAGKPSLNQL